MSEFVLQSSHAGTCLKFVNKGCDHLDIIVETPTLMVSSKIPTIALGLDSGFSEFFQNLGSSKAPWSKELTWRAFEGVLRFRATCDVVGHVKIDIGIVSDYPGDTWSFTCPMTFDLGQLPKLALDAELFVNEEIEPTI